MSKGNGQAFLGRDAILGADDLRYDTMDVPEWGGAVRVRGLTADERDAVSDLVSGVANAALGAGETPEGWRAQIVVRGVIDEHGRNIFSVNDASALGRKDSNVLERVCRRILQLSKMSSDDSELEVAVGESEGAESGVSSSDSAPS